MEYLLVHRLDSISILATVMNAHYVNQANVDKCRSYNKIQTCDGDVTLVVKNSVKVS